MYRIILFVVLALCLPMAALATEVGGDVWGTWSLSDSPYNVGSDIRIPSDSTLIIEPGVVVNFAGHYMFVVDTAATLTAVGTEADSILFSATDTTVGWQGIRFYSANDNSQVSYCHIEYGRATGSGDDGNGGAIYCYASCPTISHNSISHNTAVGGGGGICCNYSSPIISHNIICHNSTVSPLGNGMGGGIYCVDYANPNIFGNTIRNNSADFGGGIYCRLNSQATIRHNTISNNYVHQAGGGIYCYYSSPYIANTILWGDSATIGNEIHLADKSFPVVKYSNVEGGFAGEGNISDQPMFVDPYFGHYELNWGSPCIDSGDPSSPFDPDGTVADMGAHYFHQGDIVVATMAINAPIFVSAGSYFNYSALLENGTDQPQTVDVIIMLVLPEGDVVGPIHRIDNISLAPNGLLVYPNVRQEVPVFAPAGTYSYLAFCGNYPNEVIDSCFFSFVVTKSTNGGADDWELSGWLDGIYNSVPSEFSLGSNYPNPFNAVTNISFHMPVAGQASLEIYNLLGQKVVTLIDENQTAGRHLVSWDASSYSSGIYFYRLSAGGKVITRRMALLK